MTASNLRAGYQLLREPLGLHLQARDVGRNFLRKYSHTYRKKRSRNAEDSVSMKLHRVVWIGSGSLVSIAHRTGGVLETATRNLAIITAITIEVRI
jgi:hypothetical protein